jgi:hypothetical protein
VYMTGGDRDMIWFSGLLVKGMRRRLTQGPTAFLLGTSGPSMNREEEGAV